MVNVGTRWAPMIVINGVKYTYKCLNMNWFHRAYFNVLEVLIAYHL